VLRKEESMCERQSVKLIGFSNLVIVNNVGSDQCSVVESE